MSVRHASLALGALALALVLVFAFSGPSRAEDGPQKHTVYVSVTGEGPNARAWFHGAPPAGIPVQDALDQFSEKGYHVKDLRPYQRPIVTVISPDQGVLQEASIRDEFFIILLEK